MGTIAVVLFLVVWELVGNVYQLINPMFMSAPSLIAKAGVELFRSGEIWNDLYVSGVEFAWGFAAFGSRGDSLWNRHRLV